ncbi:MAG TPA: dipeptidase PepE [Gammaproteobacteria bacterium]|jgi:dipeptidase E|nr:dipeptidase PepE [Gammaproteobacteria bacterium]
MSAKQQLLLLSSSLTPGGGFLEHARGFIRELLGTKVRRVLFIPYAGVSRSYTEMTERTTAAFAEMGYELESLHTSKDSAATLRTAEAVAVSGGNTFRLLSIMQSLRLLDPLRERVQGGVPYIGWSAGSNLACPTIRTTNDMPIVWPESCDALSLVPFQINPHYTELLPPEHKGETRDDRLQEFMRLNPGMPVLGLREGTGLRVQGASITLLGGQSAKLFHNGTSRELYPEESLEFLLQRA